MTCSMRKIITFLGTSAKPTQYQHQGQIYSTHINIIPNIHHVLDLYEQIGKVRNDLMQASKTVPPDPQLHAKTTSKNFVTNSNNSL